MSNYITMIDLGNYARLGNQIFQYAFMKNISLLLNIPIHLRILNTDNPFYKTRLNECFKLNKDIKVLDENEFKSNFFYHCEEKDNLEYQIELIENCKKNKDKIINVCGYFQTEKYFKHVKKELLEDLQFRDEINNISNDIINKFNDCIKISLHIRRGDISNSTAANPPLTKKYILNSIDYMNTKLIKNSFRIKKDKLVFLVFSDDINYCKDELKDINETFVFISNSEQKICNEYIDLCTMIKCDHFILSGSSFSWWGSWLSKNESKIVVVPNPWFNINHIDGKRLCSQDKDIIPEEWIKIDL
jgi:hypothetical protein